MGTGIALLFHYRGTRRGWVVSSTPRPHFTTGKDPVPILHEAGWAPGPVWTGGKSRPHRDSFADRPARSQTLYRLSYPADNIKATTLVKFTGFISEPIKVWLRFVAVHNLTPFRLRAGQVYFSMCIHFKADRNLQLLYLFFPTLHNSMSASAQWTGLNPSHVAKFHLKVQFWMTCRELHIWKRPIQGKCFFVLPLGMLSRVR